MDGRRDDEQNSETESLDQCARDKIRRGPAGGPNEIVDAEHFLQAAGWFVFADHALERGPGETHGYVAGHGHGEMRPELIEKTAQEKGGGHDGEPDAQGAKVTVTLRETSAENRGRHINESKTGGQKEIVEAIEAKFFLGEKIEVEKIKRGGESIERLDHKH